MKDRYDNLTEVKKFNPFHDSLGKFSSAQGMKSYSANPKTKAGRMAIERSAPNHGHVMNIHAESKGENIRQNYNWIQTGQKPATQAPKTTTAKPKTPAKPNTPPAPKQPAQTSAQGNPSQAVGKDITKQLRPGARYNVNDIAEMQGFKEKPKLVGKREFDAAVKKSGTIAFRTIDPDVDVLTGKYKTSKQFADDLMKGDAKDFALNGNGFRAYGSGLYIAQTKTTPGRTPSSTDTKFARSDSEGYGGSKSSVVKITISPTAKIGDYNKVSNEFAKYQRENQGRRNKPQYDDVGAYAAAKGYDGLHSSFGSVGYGYTTIYNRSALIMYNKPEKNSRY